MTMISTMTLHELQQNIHHISTQIIFILKNPAAAVDLPLSQENPYRCDRCEENAPQPLRNVCSTLGCPSMKLCSKCLYHIFEANGYRNACPDCHQYLRFETYLGASSDNILGGNSEVKETLDSMIDLISGASDSSPRVKTFDNLVEDWERCFHIPCDCGDCHELYPTQSKRCLVTGGDMQSLMKMLRRICGASHERQFQFLGILQRFIGGDTSSSEFIEHCESFFVTHSEYSKRSHMKYCVKNGLANNVGSYVLILLFLEFIDRGMRYRVAYSLLERYPNITFRCGRYFCFRCKLLTQARSVHQCAMSVSPLSSFIVRAPESLLDSPLPQHPTESISDICSDILRAFSPLTKNSSPQLKSCAFSCCLCLEECEAPSLFDGCSNSECLNSLNVKYVCKECMLAFVKNRIESSPYSLPKIKCLNCSTRIPTAHWTTALHSETNAQHNEILRTIIQKYDTNYAQMRRSRCGSCHATYTPFAVLAAPTQAEGNLNISESFLLLNLCKFLTCTPTSVDLTVPLDPVLNTSELKTKTKKRNSAPTALNSNRSKSRDRRQSAPISASSSSSSRDNVSSSTKMVFQLSKTLRSFAFDEISPDEFIQTLNIHLLHSNLSSDSLEKLKTQINDTKVHHSSLFVALFMAIQDPERQSSAITALLKRYPHFKTKCCNVPFCYFCKISSFHSGRSCVEWMRGERGDGQGKLTIKYCPSCNVPTVRSEGCSSITCLCGRNWSW